MLSLCRGIWRWAHAPRPFRQGDLDSLCGVTAVINAIKLLSPDSIEDADYRRLHAICVETLGGGGGRAIWEGTTYASA